MFYLALHSLIAISLFCCGVSPCLVQPLRTIEWISRGPDLEQLRVTATNDDNVLVLLAYDSVFTCQGSISQWNTRWYHSAATNDCATVVFTFVVYRTQSDECGSLLSVGSNSYQVENNGPEMQEVESVFHVKPGNRIDVQEGDIIGVLIQLHSECAMTESSVWVAGRELVGAQLYHSVFSNVFSAIFITALAPCSELQRSNVYPFVSAVVGGSPLDPPPSPIVQPQPQTTIPSAAITTNSSIFGRNDGHATYSSNWIPRSSHQFTSQEFVAASSTETAPSLSPTTAFSTLRETNVPMVDSGSTTTDDVNVRGGKSKSRVHTALITLGTGCCFLLIIITAIAITVMFLLRYRAPHDSTGSGHRSRAGDYREGRDPEPRHSRRELSLPDPEYDEVSPGTITNEGLPTPNDTVTVTTRDMMGQLVQQGQAYRITINKAYGSLPV